MVKVIDYIANPAVLKKSYDVAISLRGDLNELVSREQLFETVLEKVAQLEKGCYSSGADQGGPDAKQRTKIDTVIQQKAKELDAKLILINTAGAGVDLKDYTKEHESDFYEAKFVAGDPFKKVAIKTMASGPRLDQVPLFQASTHFWSSEGAA